VNAWWWNSARRPRAPPRGPRRPRRRAGERRSSARRVGEVGTEVQPAVARRARGSPARPRSRRARAGRAPSTSSSGIRLRSRKLGRAPGPGRARRSPGRRGTAASRTALDQRGHLRRRRARSCRAPRPALEHQGEVRTSAWSASGRRAGCRRGRARRRAGRPDRGTQVGERVGEHPASGRGPPRHRWGRSRRRRGRGARRRRCRARPAGTADAWVVVDRGLRVVVGQRRADLLEPGRDRRDSGRPRPGPRQDAGEEGQVALELVERDHRQAVAGQRVVGVVPLGPLGVHPDAAAGDVAGQLRERRDEQLLREGDPDQLPVGDDQPAVGAGRGDPLRRPRPRGRVEGDGVRGSAAWPRGRRGGRARRRR
jgi:hypothetical protein